jgi:hypothetical protein
MAENKNQHYVPQLYLRKFSENGKQIGIYNIPSGRFVPAGAIKSEASEDYFYGKDSAVDERLRKLESVAGSLIKDIIEKNKLPLRNTEEHFLILKFILTLRFRTTYAKENHNQHFSDRSKFFISKQKDYDKELWSNFDIIDTNATQICVQNAELALPIISDLDFKLLKNKTDVSFWTSDNPAVLYNQFLEKKRPDLNNTGLITKGLQIFCPISPKHYLFFYDSGTYKVGLEKVRMIQVTESDVRQLNKLQFISANENLYFDNFFTDTDVKQFCHTFDEERKNGRLGYKSEILEDDGKSAVIKTVMPEIKGNLKVSFAKTLTKAERYEIGEKIIIPRSRQAIEMHNFVQSEAERLIRLNKKREKNSE